jgi:HSP20 family protein
MVRNYSPFEQMQHLMAEMDEMMAQMHQDAWGWTSPALAEGSEAGFEPASGNDLAPWSGSGLHMDVEADEEGYTVVADIPGFETEELDLRFDEDDRLLRIVGTHEESDDSSSHSRRISKHLTIPGDAPFRVGGIDATYRNGVLEIHLPTETTPGEGDRTHRIDID